DARDHGEQQREAGEHRAGGGGDRVLRHAEVRSRVHGDRLVPRRGRLHGREPVVGGVAVDGRAPGREVGVVVGDLTTFGVVVIVVVIVVVLLCRGRDGPNPGGAGPADRLQVLAGRQHPPVLVDDLHR